MPRCSALVIVSLVYLACTRVDVPIDAGSDEDDPGPPEHRESSLPDPPTTPFAGLIWGYAQASSSNGRIVLIRNFGEEVSADFGHHGPDPDAASLDAFDLVTGGSKRDELVAMESARRWFLLRHDAALWLVDSQTGQWQALADADMEDDRNPCFQPRQGNFSPGGKRVGWVRKGARELRVRDLASGEEWSVPGDGRIWVGWPNDDDQGAVLLEVPLDSTQWPQQQTSCICWWCERFAMSSTTGGWDGPEFTSFAVSGEGKRSPGEVDETSFSRHGETAGGCKLVSSANQGELLEQGPWRWDCS
jgi:hypothetical protein